MKKIKTIMIIASVLLIAGIFASAIKSVFFPKKPDEPVLFTITIENNSGIELLGYGISYGADGRYITTEYGGYAGKKIKPGDVFDISFYESVLGTTDVSSFIFSIDVNTSGDNFFNAAEDILLSAENGKTYAYVLEKTPEGFSLSEK